MSERMTTTDSVGRAVLKNPRACRCGEIDDRMYDANGFSLAVYLHQLESLIYDEDGNEVIPLDRLRAIAEAERDGRMVVFPCKVGDTVYFVEKSHGKLHFPPREDKVQRISISKRGFRIMLSEHNDYRKDYALNDGVYLTREAAEAALSAGKGE